MKLLLLCKSLALTKNLPVTAIVILFSIFFFSSCTATKNAYYFKSLSKDTSINSLVNKKSDSKIRKNDMLAISISSLNKEEDAVYNAPSFSFSGGAAGSASSNGYQVDVNGNIQLHKLGVMQVEGMTRKELKEKIQTGLLPYLKDPVVTIRYSNRRVTILGEVARPQVLQMPEEQLSLLEVLGSSGDVTPFARRDNILIIRESGSGKQFKRINLEDHSIFTSEWYYLQPDDVVYVEPNDKKINEENRNKRNQTISMALSGLSVAIIILDRIFR